METIGRYEIQRELGRGGMAAVYLAHDPLIDRPVAVKVLAAPLTEAAEFQARFRREAHVIARLEHPAIVPIYDYGEDQARPYIVMRYLPGGTLQARLGRGPLPWAEALGIVARLAEALDAAHQQGVLHRDLKPGNVLFDEAGRAFLSDFGIARLLDSGTAFTRTGLMGTPEYMSPEQAEGVRPLDARSDVYALGVLAYQMLSGRLPFQADTPVQVMYQHVHTPPPLLEVGRLGLPAQAEQALQRALAKTPEARYGSAGEFALALRGVPARPMPAAAPATTAARGAGPAPAPARPAARRWWIALLAPLPVAGLALGLLLPRLSASQAGTRTPTATTSIAVSASATSAPSATPSPSATASPTATPSPTASPSASSTASPRPRAGQASVTPAPALPSPTAPPADQPAPAPPAEPTATLPPLPEAETPTAPPPPPG